jgi:hypothetical protein
MLERMGAGDVAHWKQKEAKSLSYEGGSAGLRF